MSLTPPRLHLPKRIAKACRLLLCLVAPTLASAQCPELHNGPTFQEGTIYYVDIDVRYRGTEAGDQIAQAFNDWTYANTHNNTSNIEFRVFDSWSEVPAGANLVHVSQEAFTDQFGQPNTDDVMAFNTVRRSGVYILEATFFFNTNARADYPDGPYINPNAPGYSTIYARGTRHEIGHGMGLDHPASETPAGSVMNSASICQNDYCNTSPPYQNTPDSIQPCDNQSVSQAFQAPPPPPTPTPTPVTSCVDGDGDGWYPCGESPDCNDADPNFTDDCTGCGDDEVARAFDCYTSGGVWKTMPDCLCDYPYVGPQPGGSPILLDTAGDGFRLTGAAGGVLFDLDGDGARERIAWTSQGSDDAWLALDRDGSGLIESGRELFGNFTPQPEAAYPNGFLALAQFDRPENGGNSDGVIDGRDAVFPSLRLWRDADHDGVSEPDELRALASLDMGRLHVGYKYSRRVDEHGNEFRYRAKVDDAKGAKVNRWAWDVFLVSLR